jgi:hypothetical protein
MNLISFFYFYFALIIVKSLEINMMENIDMDSFGKDE